MDVPTLKRLEPRLNSFAEYSNILKYVFPANDSFLIGAGSMGNLLAQKIIYQAAKLRVKKGNTRLVEFSAHDNTLIPLYLTLGEQNPTGEGLRPTVW